MTPSLSTILDIKKYLSEKHIVVPNDWIEACVDFLSEEYNNTNFPLPRLRTLAYEQWLNADLAQIGTTSITPQLSTSQKTTLNGTYALQINGIRDVGRPAYGQLKQLDSTQNTDVEVTAAPKTAVPDWESKPTRMLILNLTDGVNFIQGMEYHSITCLSPNLPPGTKVQITGPLECRFGMLLLKSDKIQVLGGEVESLRSQYSRENLLREILQLPIPSEESRQENDQQIPSRRQSDSGERFNGDVVNKNGSRRGISTSYLPVTNSRPRVIPIESSAFGADANFDDDDDDFVKSIDYNALDQIEKANSQIPSATDDEINEDEDMLNEVYEYQERACRDDGEDILLLHTIEKKAHRTSPEIKNPIVPYKLLSSVNPEEEFLEDFILTIKGFIVNVSSRLECKSSKGWHLTAKISDNTSSLEADFHDKVLEKFVGIAAKDMMAMQAKARFDSDTKKKMMEAIGNCKTKLQKLNCLMEIKFSPGTRPCIVKCTDYDGP